MDSTQDIIYEYENILLGKRSSFPSAYFSYSAEQNERMALIVIRYAFDVQLSWNAEYLRDNISYDLCKKLKITPLLKYIRFPSELDPRIDLFYIVWKVYPNKIYYNQREAVINNYKKVLSKDGRKYPKEYFSGNKGSIRAGICLQYVIENFFNASSIDELYKSFASKGICNILKKYKLYNISSDVFDSPIGFLHFALPKNQKNDFLYNFYTFEREFRNAGNRLSKRRTNNNQE